MRRQPDKVASEYQKEGGVVETADVTELRYDLFLGDVALRNGTCDLSADWGWVPLLDLASALLRISRELSVDSSGESGLKLNENEATLFNGAAS